MSFTRLPYDTCTYQHDLRQSVGVGHYQYNAPIAECHACFSADPTIRAQMRGVSVCEDVGSFVDTSSELLGITRRASSCPTDKYLPNGTAKTCNLRKLPDCPQITREDTRLSNPPCTLRSTGWNRWEWLCRNPQDKALVPFEWNVSNRIVVKDNHRACLPKPTDPCPSLPPQTAAATAPRIYQAAPAPLQDVQIPSTHWRKCNAYAQYLQQEQPMVA